VAAVFFRSVLLLWMYTHTHTHTHTRTHTHTHTCVCVYAHIHRLLLLYWPHSRQESIGRFLGLFLLCTRSLLTQVSFGYIIGLF
jgi:hypothetical protein